MLTRKSSADPEIRLFYVAMTRAKQALSVAPELMAIFTGDKAPADALSAQAPQNNPSNLSTPTGAPKPERKPDFMNTLFNKASRRRANE
jgi:ATP-dependent exoDNAse (exonuclease V) beta subunit